MQVKTEMKRKVGKEPEGGSKMSLKKYKGVGNVLDWSLSLILVCFTSLVDNCQVAEVH